MRFHTSEAPSKSHPFNLERFDSDSGQNKMIYKPSTIRQTINHTTNPGNWCEESWETDKRNGRTNDIF